MQDYTSLAFGKKAWIGFIMSYGIGFDIYYAFEINRRDSSVRKRGFLTTCCTPLPRRF